MRTCFCGRPVFGTDKDTGIGYCASHQWKRTDKKKLDIKTTPMIEKIPIEHSFGYVNQTDLFFALWEKARRDGRGTVLCPFTGVDVSKYYRTPLFWSIFAHVLPKGRYPYFKLNPDNIRLVDVNFHKIIDQGTLVHRKWYPEWKWDDWDSLVLEMKDKYSTFKKENMLP